MVAVAIATVGAAAIGGAVSASASSKAAKAQEQEANTAASVAARLAAQTLNKSNTALALGMLGSIRKKWFLKHQYFLGMQVNASESAGLVGGFTSYLGHAMPSMQLALGAYLVIIGEITGGMMIAASFLLTRSMKPIKQVMGSWPQIQAARQSLERLNLIVSEDDEQSARMTLPAPTGHLVVENLVVKPQDGKAILDQLNFKLQPGQVLGVIGATAAGKTSLTRALVGLWYPSSGHVRLDGADVAPWIRDDLGAYIGYAPLETDLFEGTLAENIARLGPVDPEKVVAATKAVGIHETILSFPKGYETMVGETGQALTGGQRQRISIARAILKNAPILLLDEATSALDSHSEKYVQSALDNLMKNRTTIVIAHRLSTILNADRIVVIDKSKIIDVGTHSELIRRCKHYAILYKKGLK
jgi:ABC-type protease/lipase transport system fused ATPase/permease subunit